MARGVWERVERRTAGGGAIGLYRHGSSDDPGTCVTAVGLGRAAVDRVARLLRDGVDERLAVELVEQMCLRRARVVVEATRANPGITGRVKIRRPEDRGGVLGPDGIMRDPPSGVG